MFVIVSVLRTPDFDSGFIIFGFDYSTMDFYIKKKGRGRLVPWPWGLTQPCRVS